MIKVATLKDLKEGEGYITKLPEGEEVALFKLKEEFFAIGDTCPHMGASLANGEIEEEVVACPWHGWCFDLRTGNCVNVPGESTPSYEVVIEGQDIYLKDVKEK